MGRPSKPHQHHSGWWRTRYQNRTIWGKTKATVWVELDKRQNQDARAGGIAPLLISEAIVFWRDDPEHASSPWIIQMAKAFDDYCGLNELAEVQNDLLKKYVAGLRRLGQAARTIRSKYSYARAILKYAYEHDWLAVLPHDAKNLATIERNPKPIRFVDLFDIFRELHSRRPLRRARVLLRFILEVGCRPSEACLLRWSQIDFDAKVCTLDSHKTKHRTGKPRTLYLTAHAIRLLRAIKHLGRPGPFVFPSRLHRPYTPAGLRSIFRRAAEAATGEPAHTYQLRHTFATNARRVVAVDMLKKLLGHKRLATTELYYEIRDPDAELAAQSLVSPLSSRGDVQARRRSRDASARPRPPGTSRGSKRKRATKRRA